LIIDIPVEARIQRPEYKRNHKKRVGMSVNNTEKLIIDD
jgi:hypothetical protein